MQILKEETLGQKGSWVIKARIILIHSRIRRAELFLEHYPTPGVQEVGWTVEEIAELHNLLVKWKAKNNEP